MSGLALKSPAGPMRVRKTKAPLEWRKAKCFSSRPHHDIVFSPCMAGFALCMGVRDGGWFGRRGPDAFLGVHG